MTLILQNVLVFHLQSNIWLISVTLLLNAEMVLVKHSLVKTQIFLFVLLFLISSLFFYTSTGHAGSPVTPISSSICVVHPFNNASVKWYFITIFIFIYLMTTDIEHLFMYLVVIHMPSFITCIFKSFALLKNCFYC